MKRQIAVLSLLMLLLCSCSRIPDTYSFPNQSEAITSIEFLHNMNPGGIGTNEDNMVLLYTMSEKEIEAFLDALYELPTVKVGSPPPWGYGLHIVKITYKNGDIEMYGSNNIEYIQAGAKIWGIGDYRFVSNKDFESLIAEYVDLNELPDPPPLN